MKRNDVSEDLEQLGAEVEAELAADYSDATERASHSGRFVMMANFLRALFLPYAEGFAEFRAIGSGPAQTAFLDINDVCADGDKNALKQAYRWCVERNDGGQGIYVGVLPRVRHSGTEEDVSRAAWFWTDVDYKIGGEQAAYDAVFSGECEADIVVCSGNGLHAYYHIDDCNYVIETEEQRARFKRMVSQFQQSVLPGMDPVKDVARILRLPGFYNTKEPDSPKYVDLLRMPSEAFWNGENWSVGSRDSDVSQQRKTERT